MYFIEELQKNREQFVQLFAEKNIKDLKSLAHKLHGACCFSGVPKLQTEVVAFEANLKQNMDEFLLETLFKQLIACIDAVIREYYKSYRPQQINSPKLEYSCQ